MEHAKEMAALGSAVQEHALSLDDFATKGHHLWVVWDGNQPIGCAALCEISPTHIELKSLRTRKAYRRKGVASQLLQFLFQKALLLGYDRMSLSTGTHEYFDAARELYIQHGFAFCLPWEGQNKTEQVEFMTREI
ncbi:GNAT family N-acetyltransferase [Hydrogenophaga sp. 5NK40-0174]|uniref:GNAT family N-acetyltransferase n=1 Tax=Hydrogenophaga sp. 5NK40-0174 TaxID=3127649 RepID=UPI003101FD48